MQKASLHVSKTSESTQNRFLLSVFGQMFVSMRHTNSVWRQVCEDIRILFAVRFVKTYAFCLMSGLCLWRHTYLFAVRSVKAYKASSTCATWTPARWWSSSSRGTFPSSWRTVCVTGMTSSCRVLKLWPMWVPLCCPFLCPSNRSVEDVHSLSLPAPVLGL